MFKKYYAYKPFIIVSVFKNSIKFEACLFSSINVFQNFISSKVIKKEINCATRKSVINFLFVVIYDKSLL